MAVSLETLYSAQKIGAQAVDSGFMKLQTPSGSDHGLIYKGYVYCWNFICRIAQCSSYVCRHISDGVACFANGLFKCIDEKLKLSETELAKFFSNGLYQKNMINGKRHVILFPAWLEKKIGEANYLLLTLGMSRSNRGASFYSDNKNISYLIEHEISTRLLNDDTNKTLLAIHQPKVEVFVSRRINAFALPGGNIAFHDELASRIDRFINIGGADHSSVPVSLADGSVVYVDCSSVTRDDLLAAVVAHEMAHVASRHGIVSIASHVIQQIVVIVGRLFFVSYLKNSDKEYQVLISRIVYLAIFLNSRKHEYEADCTGAFMADQAGYNPLGALLVQEFFSQDHVHIPKWLEFVSTHPHPENRKTALFAAINKFSPESFRGRVRIDQSRSYQRIQKESNSVRALDFAQDIVAQYYSL